MSFDLIAPASVVRVAKQAGRYTGPAIGPLVAHKSGQHKLAECVSHSKALPHPTFDVTGVKRQALRTRPGTSLVRLRLRQGLPGLGWAGFIWPGHGGIDMDLTGARLPDNSDNPTPTKSC